MKVRISESEWWPVYTIEIDGINPDYYHIIEIPDELYERYVKTHEEFNKLDQELKKIYNSESKDS